jgi:hypothetical protein
VTLETGERADTTAVHRFADGDGRFVSAGGMRPGDGSSTGAEAWVHNAKDPKDEPPDTGKGSGAPD